MKTIKGLLLWIMLIGLTVWSVKGCVNYKIIRKHVAKGVTLEYFNGYKDGCEFMINKVRGLE